MQNLSNRILCCRARTWSLVIGWIQTIGSAIGLVFLLASYILMGEALKQATADSMETYDSSKFNHQLVHNSSIDQLPVNQLQMVTAKEIETHEHALHLAHIFIIMVMIIGLLTTLVQFVGGIFLVQGVIQQNVKKIKIWTVIQIVFLAFTVIGGALSVVVGGFSGVMQDILGVLITIFFLWVVNIHKQELDVGGATGSPITYGVRKVISSVVGSSK